MVKKKIAGFIEKLKKLHGDPHYVALGMAIGVFVACTPTIPFHSILAVALAILLGASKPAALLGVWVSNPFTVLFLYFACFKVGHFFFDDSVKALKSIEILINHIESDVEFSQKIVYFSEFMKTKIRTFMIMNLGGVIIGLPFGLGSYFFTKHLISRWRQQ
jgi:uncharacterized protein (DUF2062 family)